MMAKYLNSPIEDKPNSRKFIKIQIKGEEVEKRDSKIVEVGYLWQQNQHEVTDVIIASSWGTHAQLQLYCQRILVEF